MTQTSSCSLLSLCEAFSYLRRHEHDALEDKLWTSPFMNLHVGFFTASQSLSTVYFYCSCLFNFFLLAVLYADVPCEALC